ncbi:PilZ domain-containing protein [Sphingomonas sp.]
MLVARLYLSDDRRAADRVSVGAETTMRVDGTPLSAEVEDISETGCLIRPAAVVSLSVGDRVRIGLPGTGAFDAEVVRVVGNATGCRFVHPLTRDQLAAAFASNVVVAGEWSPEQTPAHLPDSDKLSVRTRLATIVGLSVGLWVAIGAIVYALLR